MPTKETSFAVRNISATVWKFPADGNVYFVDVGRKVIIDTSNRGEKAKLEQFLGKIIDFSTVTDVIFTHLHLDHCANFDLFPNATLWASQAEIDSFTMDPFGTVLDTKVVERLKEKTLHPIEQLNIPEFEIIHTPGHTKGSVCILYAKDKILFSGDTIFPVGIGRTDLPSSISHKMQDSLNSLAQHNFKILAAGHDYGLND
jgi:glyoxylase-like metal-dependent hydrolase (beta-lactamase superfamily II)